MDEPEMFEPAPRAFLGHGIVLEAISINLI